jgi:hypothetical protein
MTADNLNQLRAFYHSLVNLRLVLEANQEKLPLVDRGTSETVLQEMNLLKSKYPHIVPDFNPAANLWDPEDRTYHRSGLQSYLAIAIGRLETAIEESKSAPVTETKTFTFIQDTAFRQLIETDYEEAQKNFVNGCWKSAMILAGGTIEAILTDLLLQNQVTAKSSKRAPKISPTLRIGDWCISSWLL